ncbi:MAG: hypothetical protein CSA97_02230 [Bacteroidetes bacterium]|nr:MAG: hypothetical protein CSA97_02230 [Bacteroidota bacterium]
MQVLISEAKLMHSELVAHYPDCTEPLYGAEANAIAGMMQQLTVEELEEVFGVSPKLAMDAYLSFQHFQGTGELSMPALWAYAGQVYRYLDAPSFSDEEIRYLREHLWILSGMYGMLRPTDRVRRYRMDVGIPLAHPDYATNVDFWRPRLTDHLIEVVKGDDGVLVNLFAEEFKRLFEWRRVAREVRVIQPSFKVISRGKPKTIVVHTKTCRGMMARYLMREQSAAPDDVMRFADGGYAYVESLSDVDRPCFIRA